MAWLLAIGCRACCPGSSFSALALPYQWAPLAARRQGPLQQDVKVGFSVVSSSPGLECLQALANVALARSIADTHEQWLTTCMWVYSVCPDCSFPVSHLNHSEQLAHRYLAGSLHANFISCSAPYPIYLLGLQNSLISLCSSSSFFLLHHC